MWRIFNNYFIANCPQNASVKNFENRLIFSKDMDNHKVGRFIGQSVILCDDYLIVCTAGKYSHDKMVLSFAVKEFKNFSH